MQVKTHDDPLNVRGGVDRFAYFNGSNVTVEWHAGIKSEIPFRAASVQLVRELPKKSSKPDGWERLLFAALSSGTTQKSSHNRGGVRVQDRKFRTRKKKIDKFAHLELTLKNPFWTKSRLHGKKKRHSHV